MNATPMTPDDARQIRDALRVPMERPPIMEMQGLAMESPLSIKARLQADPTPEELAAAVRAPTPKMRAACTPVATPVQPAKPRLAPGTQLLVEFCKCKVEYWIEYRKDEAGKWTLHHADTHLMEQLKDVPVKDHSTAMQRMHYTFVKRMVNE